MKARTLVADSIRIVIVDDHSIFRSGLRADLDASVEVIGEAADVPSAIAMIRETCLLYTSPSPRD